MKPFRFSLLSNNRGSLLIWAAIIMIILTATISAAIWIVGSRAKSEKIKQATLSLDSAVNSIIGWSIQNKALPDAATFPTIVSNSKDPWGNDLIYLYDGTMTSISTGGLCGRTTTGIYDNGNGVYIAFVVLSKGPDFTLESSVTGTSGPYDNSTFTGALKNTDLYKVITLEELKNKAGCYGPGGGRFAILNSSLPDAYLSDCNSSGTTYSATIYAAGGVPFATGVVPSGYSFSLISPPAWLTIDNATGVLSGTLPSGAASYLVTVQASDNQTTAVNTMSKTFNLKVRCGTPPQGAQISFASNIGRFSQTGSGVVVDTALKALVLGNGALSTAGCSWYPDNKTLLGKTMRAYFNFKFANTETGFTDFGDGFTFALMTGGNATSVCGNSGPDLGFANGTIGTNSLAVEVDTRSDNATSNPSNNKSDPANNHIASVGAANNTHSSPNAACPAGPAPLNAIPYEGCYYTSAAAWLEDGQTHSARIELRNGYDSACNTFDNNSTTSRYALLRAWVDCNDCNDLTSDYTQTPLIKRCYSLSSNMDNVKFGFTQGTSTAVDNITISNFGTGFYTQTNGPVGSWTATTAIDNGTAQARDNHTSVVNNGYLYVIGGNNGLAQDTVYYAKTNDNGTIGAWSTTPNYINGTAGTKRYNHTSVVNNGYLYVVGGIDDTGVVKNTVYYAPINSNGSFGTWASTTTLPAARRYHASVVNNGYLYVIGGADATNVQNTVYYAKLKSDGSIDPTGWQTATAIDNGTAQKRYAHTSVVNNGYLYVIGGVDNTSTIRNTVHYAKLKSDGSIDATGWQTTTAIDNGTAQARYNHTSVVNNGYLYIIGGNNGLAQDTVYYAKTNDNGTIGAWSTTQSINVGGTKPRYAHTSIVNNGYLYVIGGNAGAGAQNTVYYVPFQ
ncbi:MAG: hypothetical protein EPN22_14610 [Nitrospirae bacterium]|nr:MAG: hypothetical protein EPN22_14610 [Nitrospirota bacterium]